MVADISMIDLHTHSSFSDGSLSPEALAALAAESELSAVALTDHDTIEGTDRFMAACSALGVRGIAGVEISADFSPGTMHILGYFLDTKMGAFEQKLRRIREGRDERNHLILNALEGLGMPLDWSAISALSGDGVVGRPHIAEAMVQRGYVVDRRMAFDRFLGKGKPAYRDRFRLGPVDAVESIVKEGGVAVLAHPFTLRMSKGALRKMLGVLADAGLAGIEVLYPEHPEELRQFYSTLAKEQNLSITGGSDFHGASNPAIQLGRGFGNVRVADSVLEELEARRLITC